MKRFIKNAKGQSSVEFALVLPVLILLLLGIMEFGRIFAGYLELQNAARDGARYAAIHARPVKDADLTTWRAAYLEPWVDKNFVLLEPSKVTDNFVRAKNASGQDIWVTLTLTYPMQVTTPIISSITGNPVNLRAEMTMRSE